MSYNNPSNHEQRINSKLRKLRIKIGKMLLRETEGDVDFIVILNSSAARQQQVGMKNSAMGFHVGNTDLTSMAMVIGEFLARLQFTGQIPPLSEIRDPEGNSLQDIIRSFDPDYDGQSTESDKPTVN